MDDVDVVVIGGGVSGLAAALVVAYGAVDAQFMRRLEDVVRGRKEIVAAEGSRPEAQEPARRPVLERFPLPRAKVKVAGAVASATAVAVIVAWGHLRRRRRRASPS